MKNDLTSTPQSPLEQPTVDRSVDTGAKGAETAPSDTSQVKAVAAVPEPFNPFDPAQIRLNPSKGVTVKRKFTTIRVGKPNPTDFCRVHPDEDYTVETTVIEDPKNNEIYLVAPYLRDELERLLTPVRLCTAMTRHGVTFLWKAKLPKPDAKPLAWHTSMLDAQKMAVENWVRVQSNMREAMYELHVASADIPSPEWVDLSLNELLKLGFKNLVIDSMDHPYVQELQGTA